MEDNLKLIQSMHTILDSTFHKKNQVHTLKNVNKSSRELIKNYGKPQIIEDCLLTLDIFKSIFQVDPDSKLKIIRDVTKNLQICSYQQGDIIYEYQSEADSIFLVFHGQVALNIRKIIFKQKFLNSKGIMQQKETQKQIYEQVDSFLKGSGFGEAEFISEKKRGFRAIVKQTNTIIGRLDISSFEEIIDNYKLRIYYKKIEMFKKCPLLSRLPENRLQFLVNNSKPIFLGMSKVLIKEGQKPKCLYLLSKGVLQIKKKDERLNYKSEVLNSKIKSKHFKESPSKKNCQDVHIGLVQQGSFIGDCEIALQDKFNYQISTLSQKVSLYACDVRLIISQIPSQQLQITKIFYKQKKYYHNERLQSFQSVRQKINEQLINNQIIALTPQQIKIKRKIQKRYTENSPSLIGQSSPLQISFMLQKKLSRLKTVTYDPDESKLPKIQVFGKIIKQNKILKTKIKRQKQNLHLKKSQQQDQDRKLQYSYSQRSNKYLSESQKVKRKISIQQFVKVQSPLKNIIQRIKSSDKNHRKIKPFLFVKNNKKRQIQQYSLKRQIYQNQYNIQKKRVQQFLTKLKQIKNQICIK